MSRKFFVYERSLERRCEAPAADRVPSCSLIELPLWQVIRSVRQRRIAKWIVLTFVNARFERVGYGPVLFGRHRESTRFTQREESLRCVTIVCTMSRPGPPGSRT